MFAILFLAGDPLDEDGVTTLNQPLGNMDDSSAMIWPFKVHRAKQPYDVDNNILLTPNTVGPEGYWTTFDWDSALARGAEAAGIPYSGNYGFTDTAMYWPTTHMVQPAEKQKEQPEDCDNDQDKVIHFPFDLIV